MPFWWFCSSSKHFFLSPRNFPVSIFSQSQAVLVKLVVKEFLINQLSIKKIFCDLSKFSLVTWEQLLYRLNKLSMYFFIPRSPERVRNPHLRAKLAETLEALVPIQKSKNSSELLSVPQVNLVCLVKIKL